MSYRLSGNIFNFCCKQNKKKNLLNNSLNKNGSNESTKLRYGKIVSRNRKSSGRSTNNCSKM